MARPFKNATAIITVFITFCSQSNEGGKFCVQYHLIYIPPAKILGYKWNRSLIPSRNGSLYQSWTVWQFWGLLAITIVNLKFEGHKWKRTKVAVNQRWGVIICKALSAPVTWPFWSCWTWWIEARSRAQKPRKMVFKWVLFICVNRTSTALPNATHNFDNFLLIPCVVKA